MEEQKKEWYVVNTYSGHELAVKQKLEMRTESMGMQDYIFRVIIPETTEVEVKDGVKKEKVKKMFPGYILVEMIMTDEAWYIVRNTPGVTGFIGSSGKGAKPTPLPPQEIDRVLATMGMSRVNIDNEMKVGDNVNIIDGPLIVLMLKTIALQLLLIYLVKKLQLMLKITKLVNIKINLYRLIFFYNNF